MINKEIVDYIKGQIEKGQNKEEIKNALISASWQAADIEEALKAASILNIPTPSLRANAINIDNYSGDTIVSPLPTVGALFGETWKMYKTNFITLIRIIGLEIVGFFLIFIIPGVVYLTLSILNINEPVAEAAVNILNWILGIWVMLSFFIIAPLVFIWGQAATIYVIKDSAENISATEAYRRSWQKVGSLFWVSLLSLFIIVGGFIFFVVPGIIFAIWFMFAGYIVISEDVGGMNALLKSREYIKEWGYKIFGLVIVIFLLMIGIWISLQIIFGVIGAILAAFNLPILIIISSIIISVIWTVTTIIPTIYLFLIYKHMQEIKGDFTFTALPSSKAKSPDFYRRGRGSGARQPSSYYSADGNL